MKRQFIENCTTLEKAPAPGDMTINKYKFSIKLFKTSENRYLNERPYTDYINTIALKEFHQILYGDLVKELEEIKLMANNVVTFGSFSSVVEKLNDLQKRYSF